MYAILISVEKGIDNVKSKKKEAKIGTKNCNFCEMYFNL